MEKFVQLISGGLETQDPSSACLCRATSQAHSLCLLFAATLFPLAEYAFSGLE